MITVGGTRARYSRWKKPRVSPRAGPPTATARATAIASCVRFFFNSISPRR